ncbi:hypothetical protein DIT68_11245 [Brumimicrobium oceani]|uniref:Uncharacterized protein n=1 Tax=Brumimicrobium oceani TaxID=2100725 RepID=A0A2U2XBX0_9FLAO|nr:hypothetical protein DIT68_11245 [Brumimicrobium oceani]
MFSLTIEINHNQSQFVTSYILRSQIATTNNIFYIDGCLNQSQIATSSDLTSQIVTSSSRSQIVTLNELSLIHTLR